MTIHATGRPPGEQEECRIRIAAAGDVHYGGDHDRDRAKAAFAALAGRTDLVLLAGDLTTHGEPEEAAILAEAASQADAPVVTVLGNHDWHSNRADDVTGVLEQAGIVVLDRSHHVVEACGAQLGIAGAKGFAGGFTGSHIPDFGEPLLRQVYAEGMAEAAGLDESLRAIAMCPFRIVLLAGDLTTHGEPEQAAILAEAASALEIPVLSVLGNHDWHSNRRDEVTAVLEESGVVVLDRGHRVLEICDTQVGVVGCKGFVGGFTGSHIPDFGEPLLRQVYAEGMAEVEALDAGLRAVAMCPFRIVLLHYAPTTETLEGERRDIWAFLGSDRLAVPIREHAPDLVLHGHAHAGTFAGRIAEVPVHNVSVPVMGEDFWVFEMTGPRRRPSELH